MKIVNEKELKLSCEKKNLNYSAVISFLEERFGELGEGSFWKDKNGNVVLSPLNFNFNIEDNDCSYNVEIIDAGICSVDEDGNFDQEIKEVSYKIDII